MAWVVMRQQLRRERRFRLWQCMARARMPRSEMEEQRPRSRAWR